MKVWVDPPEGWRYGFPKVWDTELHDNMLHWLNDRGYPPELRDQYGEYFFVRQWSVKDDSFGI